MTHQEYTEKREALMNQAFEMNGRGEDTAEIVNQITELDAQYDAQVKNEMNLNALQGQAVRLNIQETATAPVVVQNAAQSISIPMNGVAPAVEKITMENAWESQVYADAFTKMLQGKKLNDSERSAFEMVNEEGDPVPYTHTTTESGLSVVIPKVISTNIWREIEDMHPFVADIRKTFVKGQLTLTVEGDSTPAKWYEEDTETEDGKDQVGTITLNGCELARSVTLSWKLKAMSTPEFQAYLTSRMAEAMGDGLSYGSLYGAGAVEDEATEPKGIVQFMPVAQTKTYSGTLPTYQELAAARSLIKSGYRPTIYANSNMIWNGLTCIMDSVGRPIFVPDPTEGNCGRIFGCPVKEEAGMEDNQILFAEAGRAYHMNINQQITMTTEDHAKARKTDYCGYAIADGAIVSKRACSLLKKV